MGKIFRARYVQLLRKAIKTEQLPSPPDNLFKTLFSKEWISYAKRPFKGPQQILNYIGRYSHKIAITNHRIIKVTETEVHFWYKNYRKKGQKEVMRLRKKEFIRRFAMHIIPHGFIRIRHYGILSNRNKNVALQAARKALHVVPNSVQEVSTSKLACLEQLRFCPCCASVTIHLLIDVLPPPNKGSPPIQPSTK